LIDSVDSHNKLVVMTGSTAHNVKLNIKCSNFTTFHNILAAKIVMIVF